MEIRYRTQFGELLAHHGLIGHAVEIGVAEGRNAQVLIASPNVTKLYLIDAWQHLDQRGDGHQPQAWHDNNLREAHLRVKSYEHKAMFLRGLSKDMINAIPDDSLVLAYVDGDHTYDGFLTDLLAIYKKVKVGGIIAGHDYLNLSYGINAALKNFILNNEDPSWPYTMADVHQTEEDGDESMVSFWFIKK